MIDYQRLPAKWLNPFPYGWPYITGNTFASLCRLVLNYTQDGVFNPNSPTTWCFCKIDSLHLYLRAFSQDNAIVLVTANSGYEITDKIASDVLTNRNIQKWFTTNPTTTDPRVVPIPLGLGNEGSEPGMIGSQESTWTMRAIQDLHFEKNTLTHAAFDISTNVAERAACAEAAGGVSDERLPYPNFLIKLAQSMFCFAPRGTGIDTHRAWEALYLKTVPIVTKSRLWDAHPDFPAIVLDSWSDFDPAMLTESKYKELTDGFDWQQLYMYRYVERMAKCLEA